MLLSKLHSTYIIFLTVTKTTLLRSLKRCHKSTTNQLYSKTYIIRMVYVIITRLIQSQMFMLRNNYEL